MKTFVLKFIVFAILLFCTDRIVGYAFTFMFENSKGGYVGHHKYIADQSREDILIFGSSRAVHHYNSKMLSDSLGVSCYNCGQDGNGIILNYGNWQMIKKRYNPKMIIYDVTPEFDYLIHENDDENHKYLGWLKMFYTREGIPEIFGSVDKKELIKMQSMMYRYNYNPLAIIGDFIHPIYNTDEYGYDPIYHELDKMKLKEVEEKSRIIIDELKAYYLEQFIKDVSSKSEIVFVVSPYWYGLDSCGLEFIRELCHKYNVELIDFSNMYAHNDKLFADGAHLNSYGADKFSKEIILKVKKYLTN